MNLREVAKIAGVSPATASYALSGKGRLSSETRQRVFSVADRFGYRPQGAGRALATGRREVIGMVSVRGLTHTWAASLEAGLVDYLEGRAYHLLVFHAEPRQAKLPAMALRRMVDGLAVLLDWHGSFLAELVRNGIPAVAAAPDRDRCEIDSVRTDDDEGVKTATRHLLDRGHRRIAFFAGGGSPSVPQTQLRRWRAYVTAMSERSFPTYPGGDRFGMEPEEALSQLFLARPPGAFGSPTALVCCSDTDAWSAVQWLAKQGLGVPGDVSVVGFDNEDHARWSTPALTTIDPGFGRIGEETGRLLLERIDEPGLPVREITVSAKLVIRESTRNVGG
ncbi:MAG: LacI family DNA-binding transcriptional regulator [Planctomycetota bacterium]